MEALTFPNDVGFVDFLALFYSLIPFSAIALYGSGLLATRRVSFLFLLLVSALGSAINELIFKRFRDEARPPGSCIPTLGWPSGHALNAAAAFTWIAIETILNKDWATKKKVIIVVLDALIYLPVGPWRNWVQDHSWEQIGVGMGIGVFWGALFYIITRFVVQRYLEYIMAWKPIRWLRVKNDYHPNFQNSLHKGEKYRELCRKHDEADAARNAKIRAQPIINTTQTWNRKKVLMLHVFYIIAIFLLGALGVPLGIYKGYAVRGLNCELGTSGAAIAQACMTMLTALSFIPVAYLINLKLDNKHYYPELLQGLLWVVAIFAWEAWFFCWANFALSLQIDGCPAETSQDYSLIYAIIWSGVCLFLAIFGVFAYFKYHITRLYSPNLYPYNSVDPTRRDENQPVGTLGNSGQNPKIQEMKNMQPGERTESPLSRRTPTIAQRPPPV
eukprot:TRINITY_DN156_c0_g1_i1.p1 TRINITY_DN156_c0_g1~~TRINITY_DN156_c0_g1_i1.p1  ORF type:complete len:464 (-),score=90.41 TRINITY_DN156_c0_g1_i1:25-1356(-)